MDSSGNEKHCQLIERRRDCVLKKDEREVKEGGVNGLNQLSERYAE